MKNCLRISLYLSLTLFSFKLTIGQELPLSSIFSFGGSGRTGANGYEVFNSNESLIAVFLTDEGSTRGHMSRSNWRNSSGKHATVVRIYEDTNLFVTNSKPTPMSVPAGRGGDTFLAVGNYRYYYCFCCVNPEVADVKYVLPVSEGRMVKVEKVGLEYPQVYEDGLSKFFGTRFKLKTGDTIRAARGGLIETIVTQKGKELEQFNRLTIRHADQTASDYIGFEASSVAVQEGDEVFAGMPLARAGGSSLANSADLFFSASYIKVDTEKEFGSWSSVVFMDPLFETETYEGSLVHNQTYVGYINTELIIQEMSRKIKKQFRRGK
jgi:hypothetical protein